MERASTMRRIRFNLQGGLSRQDLDALHAAVLRLLSEVGLACEHKRSLDTLKALPGVSLKNGRVLLSPETTEKYIEQARNENPGEPIADDVTVTGPWNCLNIEDHKTGEIRPSNAGDVASMTKLVFASGGGAIPPVYPHNLPSSMQVLFLEKAVITLTNGDGSHMEPNDEHTIDGIAAMYQAAGRKYRLEVQFPISPLRTNTSGLETLWRLREREDINLAAATAPIPQAGLTAPLNPAAGLVQAAAEAIGSFAIARMLFGDCVECHPQFRLDLCDMRYMTTVYSSPEHILHQLLLKDVYAFYYGRSKPGHFLQSNAKRLDAQAVLERTSYMLTLALAGYRRFCLGAGQLSMDEVFSPRLYVIDREIARFVTHIIRGAPFDDEADPVEVIRAGLGEGGFMTHPGTLAGMKDAFESPLFPRMGLDQWRASGSPDPLKLASEEVERIVASHDFRLDDKTQAEVERIYSDAEKRLIEKG